MKHKKKNHEILVCYNPCVYVSVLKNIGDLPFVTQRLFWQEMSKEIINFILTFRKICDMKNFIYCNEIWIFLFCLNGLTILLCVLDTFEVI